MTAPRFRKKRRGAFLCTGHGVFLKGASPEQAEVVGTVYEGKGAVLDEKQKSGPGG